MTNYHKYPKNGKFINSTEGEPLGGQYVGEALMPEVLKVQEAFESIKSDPSFWEEYAFYQKHYIGRPSPLHEAKRTAEFLDTKARIFFKRDELNHTGSHKANNCLGQVLLAKRLNKRFVIAETGAGQHGVATASFCALFGMKCVVFMGEKDIKKQEMNAFRMRVLGAEVVSVSSGSSSLKDAMNEAMRFWAQNAQEAYYLLGTVAGPHPYPEMVRCFQSIIGREARAQLAEYEEGLSPTKLIACIGGGSNAIGLFYEFLNDEGVDMVAVEAAGEGLEGTKHSATLTLGRRGVAHGSLTYFLQDENGNISEAHSIASGLDYPGIGPEHAYLKEAGRVNYVSATDEEAMQALKTCSRLEGIIPAIEPAHALAYLYKTAPSAKEGEVIIVNICGRGDKDMHTTMEYFHNMS